MAQANKSRTPNYPDCKSAAVIPMPRTFTLTGAQTNALWEMCTLVTYTDGFTYSRDMERVCKLIADQSSATERCLCLTRAAEEERRTIAEHARRAAA